MIHRLFNCMVATALIAAGKIPAAEEWLTDLPAALQQAQKENKCVLVDFTGSDWCGWCIRLRSTILNTPEFRQYAAEKFILMEVDIPQNINKIGADQHARNRAIAKQYGITTYPSVLILTPAGEVVGGFIGGRDSLEHVIAPLDAALARYAAMQKAGEAAGEARAHELMKLYTALPADLKPYFRSMRDEIATHDPHNTTGIHTEITASSQIELLQRHLPTFGTDFEQAMEYTDSVYENTPQEYRGRIQAIRMEYLERTQQQLIMNAQHTDDVLMLKKLMLTIAAYSSPRDAESLKQEIHEMFAHPQEVLKVLKSKQQEK